MIKRDLFIEPMKSNCCSVSFSVFIDYTTRRADGMTSDQGPEFELSPWVNFSEFLAKGKEI